MSDLIPPGVRVVSQGERTESSEWLDGASIQVHDGALYVYDQQDRVVAVHAAGGWSYARVKPKES